MAGKKMHFVEAEKFVMKNNGVVFDSDNMEACPKVEMRLIADTGLVMYKELEYYDVRQLTKYLNMWLEEAEGKKA